MCMLLEFQTGQMYCETNQQADWVQEKASQLVKLEELRYAVHAAATEAATLRAQLAHAATLTDKTIKACFAALIAKFGTMLCGAGCCVFCISMTVLLSHFWFS